MNRRIAAVALASVALLGLTACTGSSDPAHRSASYTAVPDDGDGSKGSDGSGDGQSVADACALVQDTITSAGKEFEDASSGDPSQVVDAMKSAAQRLADVAPQVTNSEVAELLPALQDMFAKISEALEGVVKGDLSKAGELDEVGTSLQGTIEKFQSLCQG